MAVESFDIPGQPSFALKEFIKPPANVRDEQELRDYLKQLRLEIGYRIIPKVYDPSDANAGPSKWWMCFNKRNFIGRTLVKPGLR